MYYSFADALADALSAEGPMAWAALGCFGQVVGRLMRAVQGRLDKRRKAQEAKEQASASGGDNKDKKKKSKVKKGQVAPEELKKERAEARLDEEAQQFLEEPVWAPPPRLPAPPVALLQSSLTALTNEDQALTKAFELETKCRCHFQLLLAVATDAKLRREQVLHLVQSLSSCFLFNLERERVSPPSPLMMVLN